MEVIYIKSEVEVPEHISSDSNIDEEHVVIIKEEDQIISKSDIDDANEADPLTDNPCIDYASYQDSTGIDYIPPEEVKILGRPRCPQCGGEFATKKTMLHHIKTQHPPGKFLCQNCNFATDLSDDYFDHVTNLHPSSKINCPQCKVSKDCTRQDFIEHCLFHDASKAKNKKKLKAVWTEELLSPATPGSSQSSKVLCKFCGKVFTCLKKIANHETLKHGHEAGRSKGVEREEVIQHKRKSCKCDECNLQLGVLRKNKIWQRKRKIKIKIKIKEEKQHDNV